ncbi:MAG: fibronectin type III domain-containing protein [Planctomycetia bacterium]|nr:fibronectin type III domain-containing protein [Planctomycetia bacterium]
MQQRIMNVLGEHGRRCVNKASNHSRSLRLESLETREMLSGTPCEPCPGIVASGSVLLSNFIKDEAISLADLNTAHDSIAFDSFATDATVSVTTTSGNARKVTITWDAAQDATKYYIQVATSLDGENFSAWKGLKYVNGSEESTTYMLSSLNTYYQFRVRAINSDAATTKYATSPDVVIAQKPLAPTDFAIAKVEAVADAYPIGELASRVNLTLTWSEVEHASGYQLKRSVDGKTWQTLRTFRPGDDMTATTSVYADVAYSYQLVVYNSLGTSRVDLGCYAVPKARLNHADVVAGQTLTVTASKLRDVTIQWQSRTADSDWVDIVGATGQSYTPTDADVSAGVWIRALVTGNEDVYNAGSYIAEAIALPTTDAIVAPSNVALVQNENGSYTLSWVDASDNEEGFYVEYSIDGGATWKKAAWMNANETTRSPAIQEGYDYSFRVRAYNSAGLSAAAYLGADSSPWCVATTRSGSHAVTVSWSTIDGATEYRVQYIRDGITTWSNAKKGAASEFDYDTQENAYSLKLAMESGGTYQYRVVAYDSVGEVLQTMLTETVAYERLAAVNNFTITDATPTRYLNNGALGVTPITTQLTFAWDAVENAREYVVKYQIPEESDAWKLVRTTSDTTTTFTVSNGKVYNFQITALNDESVSEATLSGLYAATSVALDRVDVVVGEPISVVATKYDVDPATVAYQWQVLENDQWVDIIGATRDSYTPTEAYAHSWIRVQVTPLSELYAGGGYVATMAAAPVVDTLAAPSNVSLEQNDDGTYTLSWSDNSENEEAFYVDYSIDGGQTWNRSQWMGANVTSRTPGIQEGLEYVFRVRAFNSAGLSVAAYLDADASVESNSSKSDQTRSCCVVNSSSGSHLVSVTWSQVDTATDYRVQYIRDGITTWSNTKKGTASEFDYDAQSKTYSMPFMIESDATYQFLVVAYDAEGAVVEKLLCDAPVKYQRLATVENFTITDATPTRYLNSGILGVTPITTQLTFAWDAVENASEYVVKYQIPEESDAWKLVRTTAETSATFTVFNGKVYNFQVVAINSESTSEAALSGLYAPTSIALNRVDVVAGEPISVVATKYDVDPSTVDYQWQRLQNGDWVDIVGAIGNSYTPTELDAQTWIRVQATGRSEIYPGGSFIATMSAAPIVETIDAPTSFIVNDSSYEEVDNLGRKYLMTWQGTAPTDGGFYVEYSVDNGATWQKSQWLDPQTNSRYTTLYPSLYSAYKFQVRAYGSQGVSAAAVATMDFTASAANTLLDDAFAELTEELAINF